MSLSPSSPSSLEEGNDIAAADPAFEEIWDDEDTNYAAARVHPSKTKQVLVQCRQNLWRVQWRLPYLMDPLREFVIDPSLKFWTIVLPPLATYCQADEVVAATVTITWRMPLRIVLFVFENRDVVATTDVVRGQATRQLLHPASPGFLPPSDIRSTVYGLFAFSFSAAADLVGALLNPRKMQKWVDAIGNFRAYLHASGVGQELEESMMKPLFRGRLLDNMKMLNDIQKMHDDSRVFDARKSTNFNDTSNTVKGDAIMELETACRLMRFATAAYGAEIIKSAVDNAVDFATFESERKAIAHHTCVTVDDIKLLKIREGGCMLTMRHYIAVDHAHKAVVLAFRGTLSISGALIDMQAMDREYCSGRAHSGISEMADSVWKESGEFITNMMKADEYKDYDFILTGHSLGAGTATLLNVKMHVENLLPSHRVLCYGFAPPPTFRWDESTATSAVEGSRRATETAARHCVCYIHDNDCVPHLSVATIRRLSTLMDTVDNFTETMWFWNRALIFWGWRQVPEELIHNVVAIHKKLQAGCGKDDDCELLIPARVIVWLKKKKVGTTTTTGRTTSRTTTSYEAIPCTPEAMAKQNIYVCDDMVSDHMPEQYEDALDALMVKE